MDNTFRNLIKKYPLVSFFVLTFLISWTPGIPVFMGQEGKLLVMASWLGGASPGISFIILSRILSPKTRDSYQKTELLVFLISWLISTGIAYVNFVVLEMKSFSGLGFNLSLLECALMGLVPALMISSAYSNNPEVRNQFSSLIHPRGKIVYYLAAFLIPVTILVFSLPLEEISLESLQFLITADIKPGKLLGAIFSILIFGLIFNGGFNEEAGWSGFALPRLQQRYSPFISSFILGTIWAVWHTPKWVAILAEMGFDLSFWFLLLIGLQYLRVLLFRLILTWLYNKTDQGLISPMILHSSHNLFTGYPLVEMGIYIIVSAYILIRSKPWRFTPGADPTRIPLGS